MPTPPPPGRPLLRCPLIRLSLADHLRVDRYGDFLLTAAVRPGRTLPVIPREGFRLDTFRAPEGRTIPVLAGAASRERLFELFLRLLHPLGPVVDVVLETSHECTSPVHRDLHRQGIEIPILRSHFCEFEELLMNDGCTGVAVISRHEPMEVQFDEHKLLVVYADELEPFEGIFRQAGIPRVDGLKLITEGEHLHSSTPDFQASFERLARRVGAGEAARSLSW